MRGHATRGSRVHRPLRGEALAHPRPGPGQARSQGATAVERMHANLLGHSQVLVSSLGHVARAPIGSAMTILVIAITLALPAGLHVMVSNVRTVSDVWNDSAKVTLFLEQETNNEEIQSLSARIGSRADVLDVRLITREEALAEFREHSGFGDVLDALEDNPLPDTLLIDPVADLGPAAAQRLLDELRRLEEVDYAHLDLEWVQRLFAIVELAERGILLVSVLLGFAVLLIVGNTIRLDIQNRRQEIEITKLVGATDGFIRRPFLYTGLWYGLSGGLIAWSFVMLAIWILRAPVHRLADLYDSGFELLGIGPETVTLLLAASTLLGLTGSWLSVDRHLRDIEPR